MRLALLSLAVSAVWAALADRTALGEFKPELVAIRAESTQVAPGGTVWITYTWRNVGDAPAAQDYKVLVHPRLQGVKEGAYPMSGGDFWPLIPTTRWQPGVLYTDGPLPLRMIQAAPPGRYDVFVGMYLPGGGRIPPANQGLPFDGQRCKTFELTVAKEPAASAPVEKTFADRTPVANPPDTSRPAPAVREQRIEDQFVSVVLDADRPRVIAIDHKPSGARIRGGGGDAVLSAEIYDVAAKEYSNLPDADGRLDCRSAVSPGEIRYHCSGLRRQQEVVAFDVLLRLDMGRIDVRLENIQEPDGFQLIGVTFPDVVSTSDERALLILPWMRGRRVPVASGSTRRYRFGLTWDTPIVTAMLCDGKLAAILDTTDYDNQIETRIESASSRGRCAMLTALFAHRIKASSPDLQFVAQPAPGFSLDVVAGGNKGGRADWMDGARLLRSRIAARFNPMYRNATVYKIGCDSPRWKTPTCTFPQALDLVRRIYNVTDGMRAHVYLVGWQYSGHDTGYPAVDKVNDDLGGYDELVRIMKDAPRYNATITFHDNYDDAYVDSPAWDESVMAIDPDGNIKKGGVWGGGQSYIIGMKKYVDSGKAIERVRYTLARYPLRGSYHIDVLSAVPRRHDHDPRCPTGANQNIAAKIRILEEFAKGGVDVTSEGFTACFVGHMSRFRHLRNEDTSAYWGEEYIPLVPFIYHGKVAYGESAGSIPTKLLDGANYSTDFSMGTPWGRISDLLYLVQIPWQLLAEREMTDYAADETARRVCYGNDTFVEVSKSEETYTVQMDGRIIAKDFCTFAPLDGNRIAVYSKNGGPISFALPPGWAGRKRQLFTMTEEGRGAEAPFDEESGRVKIVAAPQQPYLLVAQQP